VDRYKTCGTCMNKPVTIFMIIFFFVVKKIMDDAVPNNNNNTPPSHLLLTPNQENETHILFKFQIHDWIATTENTSIQAPYVLNVTDGPSSLMDLADGASTILSTCTLKRLQQTFLEDTRRQNARYALRSSRDALLLRRPPQSTSVYSHGTSSSLSSLSLTKRQRASRERLRDREHTCTDVKECVGALAEHLVEFAHDILATRQSVDDDDDDHSVNSQHALDSLLWKREALESPTLHPFNTSESPPSPQLCPTNLFMYPFLTESVW